MVIGNWQLRLETQEKPEEEDEEESEEQGCRLAHIGIGRDCIGSSTPARGCRWCSVASRGGWRKLCIRNNGLKKLVSSHLPFAVDATTQFQYRFTKIQNIPQPPSAFNPLQFSPSYLACFYLRPYCCNPHALPSLPSYSYFHVSSLLFLRLLLYSAIMTACTTLVTFML